MFKLSIYEKVENKRGKSPDASRTRAELHIIICLKSRSHSVQNGPYKKRVERIINTRLWNILTISKKEIYTYLTYELKTHFYPLTNSII